MIFRDQCPDDLAGQNSSMISTRKIKVRFDLVLVFMSRCVRCVGSVPRQHGNCVQQRTTAYKRYLRLPATWGAGAM